MPEMHEKTPDAGEFDKIDGLRVPAPAANWPGFGRLIGVDVSDSSTPQIRLWVDDERPAPEGWIWSKIVANTIDTLQLGEVSEMSLDYVLGSGQNGGHVLEWLKDHPDRWPPVIHTHSSSLDACELMQMMIESWRPGGDAK